MLSLNLLRIETLTSATLVAEMNTITAELQLHREENKTEYDILFHPREIFALPFFQTYFWNFSKFIGVALWICLLFLL